ncbi:MAG: heme-binding domain-containing protein [Blastocatellia bacterium]|nr:heme-binding domain-containing protein [Blastocatellia bacterium]
MTKILKWSGIALAVVFMGAQIVRPEKTNPPVDTGRTLQAHAEVPPEVDAILKRACYDCHSNETKWPWYSNVAPASWFVTDHVNHGRKHLNFSDWARVSEHAEKQDAEAKLDEIIEEVKGRNMPLSSYLSLHPEAKLSDEDIKVICDWARAERERLAYESGKEMSVK